MATQTFLNFHKLANFYGDKTEFFKRLTGNLWSKVQNSRFQIQYGY